MKDIALLFPGQGAQYIGMGKTFYDKYDYVREIFDEASEILGKDMKALLFEGDEKELTDTKNAQPAIFMISYAAYKVYQNEIGIKPTILAGHSLGEISALVCAGALNFTDGMKIVKKRGELMSEAMKNLHGAMAAVSGIDANTIKEVCEKVSSEDKKVVISNYNSKSQIVISGENDSVKAAGKTLEENGAKVTFIKVSTAFHSPYMKNVGEEFKKELMKYTFKPLNYEVISNVTAERYTDTSNFADILSRQIFSPVRWSEIIYAIQNRTQHAIELAPKNILKNLAKKDNMNMEIITFEKESGMETVKYNLFPNYKFCSKNDLVDRAMAISVCTQNKNEDSEEYETKVIGSYNKLQNIKEELLEREMSVEEMREVIDLLKDIFDGKKAEMNIQKERFNQILIETKLKQELQDYVYLKFN